MPSGESLERLTRRVAVARGAEPADLVLRNGRIFSAFTREWLDGDLALVDGAIAGVGEYEAIDSIDVAGGYVVPGFVDAHMHFETTKLLPDEFARLVLPLGTTCVVADPHELANVLGPDGVHWLVDFCRDLPLDVYFMAPSSVPASPLESPRRPFGNGDLASLLRRRRVLGLAEMMNFPGVVAGDARELSKLTLDGVARADGHAPGVLGKALNAYAASGVRSDHEALTYEEGAQRLRAGMWLLIRDASMARNLEALVPLILEFGPSQIGFCTDDRDPEDIVAGHINGMVRKAVAAGVRPEDALVVATLNSARCHGLGHLGSLAPGAQADILVLPDLERFEPALVLKAGRPVGEIPRGTVPEWVRQAVRIGPLGERPFAVASGGGSIRVIGLRADQVVTDALVETAIVRDGHAVADADRDLAKIAVVERHHATGRTAVGFVRGSGLSRGALASSVAHDAHNIVAIGVDDDDLRLAVERVAEIGGGLVVAEAGGIAAECPLPVAGLLSDAALEDVIAQSDACNAAARRLGWRGESPFMTLSFLALSVIPALKITDNGLVDVERAAVVPLHID